MRANAARSLARARPVCSWTAPLGRTRGMQIVGHVIRVDVDGRLNALDMRDIVMRQFSGAGEMPGNLQKAKTHEVRAQRDAQVDNPLRNLEIGRRRTGLRDVVRERRAE